MNKYSRLRDDLIARSRVELLQYARAYQRAMVKNLETNWIPNLEYDPDTGRLTTNPANIRRVFEIDKIRDQVAAKEGEELVRWFTGQLDKLATANSRYFSTIDPTRALKGQRSVQNALKTLLRRIGYDGNKAIRGGFLFDLMMSGDPVRKIKAEAFRAIGGGLSYRDFLQQIKITILGQRGPNGKRGVVETHFRTAAYDSFAQFDRQISNKTSEDLELNWAVYGGGLMETSRDFCRARNARVFSREEIAEWTNLTWKGKSTPYDPFLDLGGYNCTHKLDWITERLAKKLREEQDKADAEREAKIPKGLKNYNEALSVDLNDDIFDNLNDPVELLDKESGGNKNRAYFNPKTNKVVIPIDDRRKRSKWYAESVVYHEYGHAIDHQLKISERADIKSLMDKHRDILGANSNKLYTEIDKKLKKLEISAFTREKWDAFEQIRATRDTIMSLNPYFGYGHDLLYWKGTLMQEKEFVAHIFENKYGGNGYFKRYLPDLYKDMIDYQVKP